MSLDAVAAATRALPPTDLEHLSTRAALQSRHDRKYIVDPSALDGLVAATDGTLRVLEIDGRRAFDYHTTYFDTPDLVSFTMAARGRPSRFKVRVRRYGDSPVAWLEVKTVGADGATHKDRIIVDTDRGLFVDPDADASVFVRSFPVIAPHVDRLAPSIVTSYARTTLHVDDPDPRGDPDGQRITIDVGLRGTLPDGTAVPVGVLGDLAIVETKSLGERPGPFDRALWHDHLRPGSISKYAVTMIGAHPDLPRNKWHRTLTRYSHPTPTEVRS